MAERVPKINSLFKKEIGKIISRDIDFPVDILVTITEVDTSPNLIQSKIYISVFPETKLEEAILELKKNVYDIQKKLNKKLNMRPIPKIIFMKEKKIKEADKIEGLLERLKDEEK